MITIEKNVPVPGFGDLIGTTFQKMQVSDSFLIDFADDKNLRATLYRKMKQAYPREFITRSVEGGVRVWRTA